MQAILSSIIIVALQRLFVKVTDIKKYYRLSIPDMVSLLYVVVIFTDYEILFLIDAQFIWIVVFLATVFLGVDIGLGVGVGFAMLLVVVRTVV